MRQFAGRNFAPYRIVSDIYAPPEGEAIMDSYDGDSLLPDLTDSATLGCLLSLVREAWGDNTASTAATRELDKTTGWIMDCWNPQSPLNKVGPFKTEAEALVAALEAAP
jgi:hypothetical protein